MRILLASHTAPGGLFTVGSHHLARELATRGHEVAHLSSPVSLAHLSRWQDPETRRRFRLATREHSAAPGVTGLLPLTLAPLSAGPVSTSRVALATALPRLRTTLRRSGFDRVDVLLVDQPLVAGLQRYVANRALVYRSTDIVESRAKIAAEGAVLAHSDALVATSSYVMERLQHRQPGLPGLVLDNGVDFGRFAAPDRTGHDEVGTRRGAVYVGAIDDRFDWPTVAALAERNPDAPIDLYGPVTVATPGLPASVRLHGGLPYQELPAVLRSARVGLLPFRRTSMNEGRSPMKLFEYLAAGLHVLTTLPPSVAPRPPGVRVLGAEDDPSVLSELLAAGPNEGGVQAARAMDWAGRAQTLTEFLERLLRDRR